MPSRAGGYGFLYFPNEKRAQMKRYKTGKHKNKNKMASVICKALLFSSIHQSGLNMEKISFII